MGKGAKLWLILATAFAMVLITDSGVSAPETEVTSEALTESTTATESNIFASDVQTTQSIFLIGEKVSLDEGSPVKGPFPPLLDITTSTLGGTVSDFTSQGLTIAQTAAMVAAAKSTPPDVTIVFAGYTDEKRDVDNDEQRVSLEALKKRLISKNPAMRIFLVPAATTVGALTSANLRLVAGDNNTIYVPLGTEVSGEPYQEALETIKTELTTVATTVEDGQAEAAAPSNAVFIRGRQVGSPEPEATPPAGYVQQKDTLQQELDRIAGESGDAQSLPSLADTTITTFTDANDPATTTGAGGTITKRGAEAQQSINMRPLPAVKAFRPQMPVPRNNIDVKEPALSR